MPDPNQLAALLQAEISSRKPLMLRPPKAGNPVMEEVGGGFQITPEELAFKPQGDTGRAWGRALFQGVLGGPGQGVSGYRKSMARAKAEQSQEVLDTAYNRLIETKDRTVQDLNEMAFFRAKLTGEPPRIFRPPGLQTTMEDHAFTDEQGVPRIQQRRVTTHTGTGKVVDSVEVGDPTRQYAPRRRASLTEQQVSDYRNTLDVRAMVASGGWEQQVLDVIKAIDPERDVDINNEGAAMALIRGVAPSARVAQYVIDFVSKVAKAHDSVPGDPESQEPMRRKMQREHTRKIMDIWRTHKYGDPAEGVTTDPAGAGDMDARLKALGAAPAAATTQDPPLLSLLSQARAAFGGGGDPYARQRAPLSPEASVLRSGQAPERLQPLTTPRVSGAPFEGGRQLVENVFEPIGAGVEAGVGRAGTRAARALEPIGQGVSEALDPIAKALAEWQGPRRSGETYKRQAKKFQRGDRAPRKISPLEQSLAAIVSGENTVSASRGYDAAPAFNPFASRSVGPEARMSGGASRRATVQTPNVMAGIREQLTNLDLAVERAMREEEAEDARGYYSRKDKTTRKKKVSKLRESIREAIEGGDTRRASVSTPDIMAEIRRQLTELDLAVR